MRTFTGIWSTKLTALFFLAIASGIVYFGVRIAMTGKPDAVLGSVAFFLLAAAVASISIFGLVESFTTYEVDPERIRRKAWNGDQTMRWSEVVEFDKNGQQDGVLKLFDSTHRRLTVYPALFRTKDCQEFLRLIEPHLAPLRERREREIQTRQFTYHPLRAAAWGCIGLLVLFLIAAGGLCLRPAPPDQEGARIGLIALTAGMAAIFSALIAAFYTEEIVISGEGLRQRSWFQVRKLPYEAVTSMSSKMMYYKSSSWEETRLKGDKTQIVVVSKMADYPAVMEFIQSRVKVDMQVEGSRPAGARAG